MYVSLIGVAIKGQEDFAVTPIIKIFWNHSTEPFLELINNRRMLGQLFLFCYSKYA